MRDLTKVKVENGDGTTGNEETLMKLNTMKTERFDLDPY